MAYGQIPMGYQYETSPRKLRPEYEPQTNPYIKKKSTAKKSTNTKQTANGKNKKAKSSFKPHVKVIFYIIIGFAILFAISYRNSLITENFNKKEDLKKQLSVLQKENAQQEISIQNSLNLANIEKSASSKLGMKKLDDSQKVYVSLPKRDYVEPASEQVVVTEKQNWFERMLENIAKMIK